MSVGPSSAQWRTWWARAHAGGAVQPGQVQPRSRSQRWRRWARVKRRATRPRVRGSFSVPRTWGMSAASQARRRRVSGARRVPSATVPRTSPAPVPARRSARVMVTCRVAAEAVSVAASIVLAAWQTWVRASTRRCPAGRRSASPVSVLGAGAVRGPMAASRVAAWSGVIHSWYSVRSPDSRCGIDSRAAVVSRCCRSSRAPWWPWSASSRGRSRRISEGPHCWARSTSAVVTVGTVSGRSSGTSRALSRSTDVAVEASRAPEATWDQTTPTGDCGSGPSEASSPDPDLGRPRRPARAAPPTPHRPDAATVRAHAPTRGPHHRSTHRGGPPPPPPTPDPPTPPPRRRRPTPSARPAQGPTPRAAPHPAPPTPPAQPRGRSVAPRV